MAGALFHSVTSWEPTLKEKEDSLTPGRISHVFFFPSKSYQTLKDKDRDWSTDTAGGSLKKKQKDLEKAEGLEESVKKLIV